MAKHSAVAGWWFPLQKRWLLALLIMLSISTVIAFLMRAAFDSCDSQMVMAEKRVHSVPQISAKPNSLLFMKSKIVVLVSHELSLSGNFSEITNNPILLTFLSFKFVVL